MKVTERTKQVLAYRRQRRELLAKGYREHETDWEVVRGAQWDKQIVGAVVSVDGKSVYTLIGEPA